MSSPGVWVGNSLTKFLESHPLKSEISTLQVNICVREEERGRERKGGRDELLPYLIMQFSFVRVHLYHRWSCRASKDVRMVLPRITKTRCTVCKPHPSPNGVYGSVSQVGLERPYEESVGLGSCTHVPEVSCFYQIVHMQIRSTLHGILCYLKFFCTFVSEREFESC